MNRMRVLPLLILSLVTGCTHGQLRFSTVRQGSTLTEINYKQVLDNMAICATDPNALPYFALATTGNTQITDTAALNALTLNWHPYSGAGTILGSRAIVENWGLIPVVEPDRLEAMRCAYQMALGAPAVSCEGCDTLLKRFLNPYNPACQIPSGWFFVSKCKKDVPKHALHGHYNGTYVWVRPDGMAGLSRFTLTILFIATVDRSQVTTTVGTPPSAEILPAPSVPSFTVPRVGPGAQFYPQAR